MGYKRAIVLGNGESRRGIDIPDDCDVWGTNWACKEMPLDFLVSTDITCQHLIYRTGYCNDNTAYYLDWDPLGSDDISLGTFSSTGAVVDDNEYTEHGVVIGSEHDRVYFTYLDESDKVTNVKLNELPIPLASGQLALYLAAKSGEYNEILYSGFGDNKHIRTDDVPNLEVWKKEREYIMHYYSDIKWRKI